jgi:8-oxo-dGTP pyrophosphatase MutT (NUDIX family)
MSQEETGLRIKPRLLRVPTYQNQFDPSAGYVGGSRLQENPADRRLTPSPGFIVEIPLR